MPRRSINRAPLLIAPNAIYLILLIVAPLAYILVISFRTYDPSSLEPGEFTFENYEKLWSYPYLLLASRSLIIAVISTALTCILAYPLAYYLARSSLKVKMLGIFLIIMPLMISSVVRTYGWVVIFNRSGLLNQILVALDLPRMTLLHTRTAVIIGLVQLFLPFMVVPLMASIERIHPTVEEAARNLGANWVQVFYKIILPLSVPGLLSGGIITFVLAVSAFVTPALLGGPKDRMLGQQIYEKVLMNFNLPEASALTVVLMIGISGLGAAALYVAGRYQVRRRS